MTTATMLQQLSDPAMSRTEQMATVLAVAIHEATTPLLATIVALHQRLAALEARRALRYIGIWQAGQSYADQEAVSHHGGIWIALRDTVQTPGAGPDSGWVLACRRGQDGKNGRDGKDAA